MKKFTSDFFYRSNKRNQTGVNWFFNWSLPDRIRECAHAISIKEEDLGQDIVEVDVYYINIQSKKIFKGRYQITQEKITDWLDKNGLYQTQQGNHLLVIPVVLWEQIEKSDKQKEEEQTLKLF